MEVLVDTSIWIDYFRCGNNSKDIDYLIDENIIVTNEIILAELIPYLKIKKQLKVIDLLHEVSRLPLNIHWEEIIDIQVKCLKSGQMVSAFLTLSSLKMQNKVAAKSIHWINTFGY